MEIREISEKDIEELVILMGIADNRSPNWAKETTLTYLRKKDRTIMVAVDPNKIIGYVGIKEFELENKETMYFLGEMINSLAHITWIAVSPEVRGKGVASKLLLFCESWAKKRAKKGIWLDCRENVIGLYEKSGYIVAGHYSHLFKKKFVLYKLF